ncbi:MAG: AI-2E family transporter [Pseudomonadota bacterium]
MAPQDRDIIRTTSLAIIATVAVLACLKIGEQVAIPIALAALSAMILTPAATLIERARLPRSLSSLIVVAAGGTLVAGIFYVLLPTADEWRVRGPELLRDFERVLRNVTENVSETAGIESEVVDDAVEVVGTSQNLIADLALGAPSAFASVLFGIFLTYFLIAERARVLRGALCLGSTLGNRMIIGRMLQEIRQEIGTYLFTITLINIALGTLAGLMFWALGVPTPAVWGILVALLNFMPYIGPMIMNVIVFAVCLVAFGTVEQAILPVGLLVVLNLLEGSFVTPSLVGRQAQVSALAVFLAVALGGWLWGAAGALIATPALIIGRSFARRMI